MSGHVVVSKLKELINKLGLRMSGDFADALDAETAKLVERACKRAKENGRGTVQPRDL